ncbi:MAG TPA: DUF2844 domain-containing protein [Terriglobales bacterium]|nr:DUF2844 domain-containing protein [Terriglobales bacterium]
MNKKRVFHHPSRSLSLALAASVVALAFCVPALASLGGDVSSVEADGAHMKATANVRQTEKYAVHEIKASGGTVVNEYVSPAGRVFAVSWRGPFIPEMQQILGAYFQQFSAALQSQKKQYGHHPLNLQEPGLVVQTGGHMRAYVGRAYVPEMLPQGVHAEEIK